MPNIHYEGDIDIVIDEIVKINDFEKPDTGIEIYESLQELKYPPEYEDGSVIILD